MRIPSAREGWWGLKTKIVACMYTWDARMCWYARMCMCPHVGGGKNYRWNTSRRCAKYENGSSEDIWSDVFRSNKRFFWTSTIEERETNRRKGPRWTRNHMQESDLALEEDHHTNSVFVVQFIRLETFFLAWKKLLFGHNTWRRIPVVCATPACASWSFLCF